MVGEDKALSEREIGPSVGFSTTRAVSFVDEGARCALCCILSEIALLRGLEGLNAGSWCKDSPFADGTDVLVSLGAAGVASISRTSRLSTPRSFIPRSLTVPSLALTVLALSSTPRSSISITSGSHVIWRGARVERPPEVSLAQRLPGLSRRWTVRSVVS